MRSSFDVVSVVVFRSDVDCIFPGFGHKILVFVQDITNPDYVPVKVVQIFFTGDSGALENTIHGSGFESLGI